MAITKRINDDIPYPPLAARISSLPALGIKEIGSVFRLDHSALDGGDMLGSDGFLGVSASIEKAFDRQGIKKRRPDWRDWDHLHGHFIARRDVFLTWDRPLLSISGDLDKELGVVVMKPQEFLKRFAQCAIV